MDVRMLGSCGSRIPGQQPSCLLETSFPNRLESLALETGHLTPKLLSRELAKLDKQEVPVKIFHMKPQYLEEISAELASCQKCCRVLNGNERFVF